MTELLQKAIDQMQQLTPEKQDAIANLILAELEDEQKWDSSFANTTDEQWEKMTQKIKQEIINGKTIPIDDIFPSK